MASLLGTRYLVRITCADPEYIVSHLSKIGVTIKNVILITEYTVEFEIESRSYTVVLHVVDKMGCKLSLIHARGISAVVNHLKVRSLFVVGILILVILTIYIPTRIFFISVEGNERIGEMHILQCAESCGLLFGASRTSVRSEQIKNALLQAIPDLKWVGINTYGCHAVISVLERELAEQNILTSYAGIYAARDGVISSVTATKGTPLCSAGQAVSEGQLLISGYTDTGIVVRAGMAEGEVRAVTQHQINAIVPRHKDLNSEILSQNRRLKLQIGKKRINLYFNSGNFDVGCGKIYKIYVLTLPGGFQLPISLIKETVVRYAEVSQPPDTDGNLYKGLLRDYLSDTMVAGKILNEMISLVAADDLFLLNGNYICEEMISKMQYRESE